MLVELRALKPNPMRDFIVDPIDEENISKLAKSIKEDGFWGGVVCREAPDGTLEIAAGQHRVKAALKAGINKADIFVADDLDDAGMVRIYSVENATQRGNTSTAVAGTIAAAIRYLARAILGEGGSGKFPRTSDLPTLRGNLSSEKGMGRDIILAMLHSTPGINEGTVQQQLAVLKASGDYQRIVTEVTDALEREHREAMKQAKAAEVARIKAEEAERKAIEAAKEAAAKARAAREEADKRRAEEAAKRANIEAELAAKRRKELAEEAKQFDAMRKQGEAVAAAHAVNADAEVRFDYEGVARHLKNPHQLDVFRKLVTGQGIAPYLAVQKQAALAGKLVDMALKDEKEISARFIHENVTNLVLNAKRSEHALSKEERLKLERKGKIEQARLLMDDFARNVRTMSKAGLKLAELAKDWPKDIPFPVTAEFRNAFDTAKHVIAQLDKRL